MNTKDFLGLIAMCVCLLSAEVTLLTSPQRGTGDFGGNRGATAPSQPASLPSGPASISGIVLRSDNRTPIEGAEIQATGAGGVATMTTDASGRFTFKDIAAGNYTIRARRDGFFGTTLSAATTPMQNTTVSTSAAQPDATVQTLLMAAASVGGRVTHSNGRSAPEARISAMRFRYVGGGTTMATFGNTITDADGNFRISGIEPGELYLRAAVVRNAAGESIPATVTYFPSAREYSSGTLLTAAAGLELVADIQLVEGIRRRISGRITGADPKPAGVVFALPPQGATVDSVEAGMARNIAAANGSFQMETMRPGVY